jgi:hypothetical protein
MRQMLLDTVLGLPRNGPPFHKLLMRGTCGYKGAPGFKILEVPINI